MAIPIKIFHSKAKYIFRLFLLLTIFNSSAFAQQVPPSQISTAFRQYLNFEFDSCRATLQYQDKSTESLYLSHLLITTQIFLSDDQAYYKSRKYLESDYLTEIDNSTFDAVSKAFLKTELKIQWSVLKMKYGEEISAFWSMRQAFHLAQDTRQ